MDAKWPRFVSVATVLFLANSACAASDEESIAYMMQATFDKPEARLVVSPTVVLGDYAVAGWSQGDMGGRALLKRQHGVWMIILCAGDEIRSASALVRVGLPSELGERMAAALADAEKREPPERVALFGKFHGIVTMESSHHPRH